MEKYKGIKKFSYITRTACLKFDLPVLIPDKDKVLYLDSDVIIQKDLCNLYEINIEDYYAAAVKDFVQVDNNLNINNYFNAGVMLLNLKLMRGNDSSAALLSINKSAKNLRFMDQDCFNIHFHNKVKLLPLIYNLFYNLSLQNEEKYTLERINKCFETNYSSLDDMKKDSYIIHMVGYDKPWIYFDSVLYRDWNEYYKKSPFKLHKLKQRSTRLHEFIISHHLTNLPYIFFRYWRDNGFKSAMGKVRKKFFDKRHRI